MRRSMLLLLSIHLIPAGSAFGWGERGHDLVSRTAARLLVHDAEKHATLVGPFVDKEHMLAHLSNIPDIHWRNEKGVGKDAVKFNSATHFVDIEYLMTTPSFEGFPRTPKEAEKKMASLCAAKEKDYVCPAQGKDKPRLWQAGSGPWRVQQLTGLMTRAFQRAGKAQAKNDAKGAEAAINEALLYGGLLSHFVGDLGNPYHATRDYDGWEVGQGGIHSYFETDVVNAFDFSLDQEVLEWAVKNRPAERLANFLPKDDTKAPDAFAIAVALTLDSFSRLSVASQIDRTHALEKESKIDGGLQIKAERKKPDLTKKHFRALIVERLATAADTLARLWKLAWTDGGKPDLSGFHSWEYPLAPGFVPVDYE